MHITCARTGLGDPPGARVPYTDHGTERDSDESLLDPRHPPGDEDSAVCGSTSSSARRAHEDRRPVLAGGQTMNANHQSDTQVIDVRDTIDLTPVANPRRVRL
jgi:hypothetical protein